MSKMSLTKYLELICNLRYDAHILIGILLLEEEMSEAKTDSADLVAFANLDTCASPEDEVLSECLYRTVCLIAYGEGNGCFKDIDSFVSIRHRHQEEWDSEFENTREVDYWVYEVMLPYVGQINERPMVGELKIPRDYRNVLSFADRITWASRAIYETESYQIFTFCFEISDREKSEKWACSVAGQLIINAHVTPFYIGIYDSKPLFEPSTKADRLWLAFAELKPHQFPGICAVCGKAIDRKRESGGGKPKITCCKDHSIKFQNIKKTIKREALKIGDTSLSYTDKLEEAARTQCATDSKLNERRLLYPGIDLLAGMQISQGDAKVYGRAGGH